MSLKHLLAALTGAALLAAGPAGSAAAAPSSERDSRGPACADITDGRLAYDGTDLLVRLVLAAPACSSVTYTTVVLDGAGGQVLGTYTSTAFGTDAGTGQPVVDFAVAPEDGDGSICIYSTTSAGQHVFDRAPDTGCAQLNAADPPSGFSYR